MSALALLTIPSTVLFYNGGVFNDSVDDIFQKLAVFTAGNLGEGERAAPPASTAEAIAPARAGRERRIQG